MNHGFIFNLDPVLFRLGPFQIRYYGIIFTVTILLAFLAWRRQMLRGGYSQALANRFFVWGIVAIIVGARLGHCLFYDPGYYASHPLDILHFWQGGLASHGATAGLFIALILFARTYRIGIIELFDRFAMSAAIGAAGIRLGNFLNSEIVGRVTDLPWAVRFVRYDQGVVARHPSQLYEFALGLGVLLVIYLVDRKLGRESRPLGLLAGLFFSAYFAGRFFVEFFKEYQVLNDSFLTMGQFLSIGPFFFGLGLLFWAKRNASRQE